MRHRYVKSGRKKHSAEKNGRCKGPGAGTCLGSSRNTKARVAEAVRERGQSGRWGGEGVKEGPTAVEMSLNFILMETESHRKLSKQNNDSCDVSFTKYTQEAVWRMEGRVARSCEDAPVAWTTMQAVGVERRGKQINTWYQHLWSTECWLGTHQGIFNTELGASEEAVLVASYVARVRRLGLRPQETSSPRWEPAGTNFGDLTSSFQFPNIYDVFLFLKGHCQRHYLWQISVSEIRAWKQLEQKTTYYICFSISKLCLSCTDTW